jgi:hypothetical protein
MSMSQEEIEALMNGLDISETEEATPEEPTTTQTSVNTDEIEQLISQTDDVKVEEPIEDNSPMSNDDIENLINETSSDEVVSNDDIDDLINSSVPETVNNDDIDNLLNEVSADSPVSNDDIDALINSVDDTATVGNDDIDDLLKDLENDNSSSVVDENNFDDILAGIDGVVDTASEVVVEEQPCSVNEDEIVKNWTDSKINEGIIPLPAEKDTKVVNQLSQVANDSEEKVGQIFDVLSLGLDNNNEFRNKIKDLESFLTEQTSLLNSLNTKFPNINVFKEHLDKANSVNSNLESLKTIMNEEDMKIFEAMELMQFNDINRQKIERVMAVIRKLSLYLNNLFEDGEGYKDVAVARHIHGDDTHDLIGDDLDKLIEEFGKK